MNVRDELILMILKEKGLLQNSPFFMQIVTLRFLSAFFSKK